MTAKKDLKRLVRARATKTGESYAAALRHFRKHPREAPAMARPEVRRLRRVEKPEHGFAIHVPEEWDEEPPDPFNSEWEVARFRLAGPSPRLRNCLVFRSPEAPGADPLAAARRAEANLTRTGFGNFRHVPARVAGLPAARLDFDRPAPGGGTWSVRHHFVVAPGRLFCLSFGTTAIAEDAPLLDALAAHFELVGDPPGAASPGAGAGTADAAVRPRPHRAIRIDEALRRRVGPYSARARRVLVAAHEEAIGRQAAAVDEEHLLAGLAAVDGSAGLAILAQLGVSRERLHHALESILPAVPAAADQGPVGAEPELVSLPLGEHLQRTLTLAEEEARALGLDYVGVEHFVLALLRRGTGPAHEVLSRLGVTADVARAVLRQHLEAQRAAQSP